MKFPQIAGVSANKCPVQCLYSQIQPGSKFGGVKNFAIGKSRVLSMSILLT